MSERPAWTNKEPVEKTHRLNNSHVERVLAMIALLREPHNLRQVAEIKDEIATDGEEHLEQARHLFDEFTEDEKQALWVAPTYGGIFTTFERKVLRNEL